MVWNFLIIGGVVIIFIILARRVPAAIGIKQGKTEISPEKITTIGLIAQADEAFDRKDFAKAEELYIKAASQEPSNAKIYNKLGAIYLEQSNFYDAKESFLQSIRLEPEVASRHVNLGLAYLGLKDYFKAGQALQDALQLEPKNKKYLVLAEKVSKLEEREKRKR